MKNSSILIAAEVGLLVAREASPVKNDWQKTNTINRLTLSEQGAGE